MSRAERAPGLGTGQAVHLAGLAILLPLAGAAWHALGRPAAVAFWTAIAVPVAHQVFVWLAWRLELRSGATGATIGFRGYLAVFFALFGARFLALGALAWLDRGRLGLAPLPRAALATALALPALRTAYDVHRRVGLRRAAGSDHFDPRDRALPWPREGVFRLTANAMYAFAFLGFWAIAVAFDSPAALVAAAFAHAHVWVHYLATERPDLRFLYGPRA